MDDNATNLTFLKRQLTQWGLDCDTTADPTAVVGMLQVAMAARRTYRLVLVDSTMPVMSGNELTSVIRTTPATSSLPVLMLTSSGSGREAAADAGVDAFVTKPINADRLLGEIQRGLRPRPAKSSDREMGSRASGAASVPVDGPLVLIAEDNQINQRLAVALLRKRGLRIDVAGNGREAVEMSTRADYAAIFMDCQMPELDGYQATEEIREHESSQRHVPIVAVTADTMTGDRERCLAAGMDEYIGKPIRADDLDGVLTRVLGGQVSSSSHAGTAT